MSQSKLGKLSFEFFGSNTAAGFIPVIYSLSTSETLNSSGLQWFWCYMGHGGYTLICFRAKDLFHHHEYFNPSKFTIYLFYVLKYSSSIIGVLDLKTA